MSSAYDPVDDDDDAPGARPSDPCPLHDVADCPLCWAIQPPAASPPPAQATIDKAAWAAAKDRPEPGLSADDPAIAGAAAAIAAARAAGESADGGLFASADDANVVVGVDFGRDRASAVVVDAGTGAVLHVGDDQVASPEVTDPPPAPAAAPPEQGTADAPAAGSAPTVDGQDPTGVMGAVTGAPAHHDDALEAAMTPQLGLDLGIVHDRAPAVKLTDRFVVPPFSTLDSRQDYWKQRKRAWLGLGIQSELGREGTLTYQTDTVLDPDFYRKKEEAEAAVGHKLTLDEFRRDHYRGLDAPPTSIQNTGTSIFDPVVCEVAYRWFSPRGGIVLDPFAGGSVRGVTAAILGRRYVGIELRPEQVAANRRNAGEVIGPDSAFDFGAPTPTPLWIEGDATQALTIVPQKATDQTGKWPGADLVFTCPPYADLEVYSDDPADLSTMRYPTFRAMLASAMAQSVDLLRDHRFAVWVVGEARDPRTGLSYGIIRDTVNAAIDAGLGLYNEAILETAIASAAMRATKQVLTSRKLVRVHQHVLVFVKGDARKAADACGDPLIGGAA